MLGDTPCMQFAGSNVNLTITVDSIDLMIMESGEVTLTLNAPIATKVVRFSRLLKCLRSLNGKQCGPRSDFPYRSSLFWVHAVCFFT